ncbi:hypothetical protein KSS87_008237 [Heliosperma pusillum]|nr:hypothetical protein KSS87_008237 [Heliosperma pusillum]
MIKINQWSLFYLLRRARKVPRSSLLLNAGSAGPLAHELQEPTFDWYVPRCSSLGNRGTMKQWRCSLSKTAGNENQCFLKIGL